MLLKIKVNKLPLRKQSVFVSSPSMFFKKEVLFVCLVFCLVLFFKIMVTIFANTHLLPGTWRDLETGL